MEKIIKNGKNLVLSYCLSLALAVCYLAFFEFSYNVFVPALIFVFEVWLDRRDFISKNKKLGLMWLIFNFGLFGFLASLISFTLASGSTVYFIGVTVAGIVCCILQYCMDDILKFIQYGVKIYNYSNHPYVPIVLMYCLAVGFSDLIRHSSATSEILDKQLVEEKFVPIEFNSKEIHNGHTVYYYEAKGKMFFIKPNELPEIRKASKNFKAKIVLGEYYNTYGAYKLKRIEFEKKE